MMIMVNRIRKVINYIIIFFCVLAVLTSALIFVAKIPQAKIADNMRKSAIYLCEKEVFFHAIEGVPSTMIDRYADSILLAIAYQYDSEAPLSSVAWSSYYANPLENENENLYEAVTKDKDANQQYLRYWHGSNVFVRVLHLLFDIRGIYICNAVVMALLYVCLATLLIRQRARVPAVGITIALIATGTWFVPFSLEYAWTYIVMLTMSVIGVCFAYKKAWNAVGVFFMVGGMVTNYVDFLTTETLTFTVPFLLLLWIRSDVEHIQKKEAFVFAGKSAVAWGAGYVGMWVSKWMFASAVLGCSVMPYVTEHIGERIGGTVGLRLPQYLFGALARNVRCLFPLDYGVSGLFVGLGIGCFSIYLGYVHYGKKEDKSLVLLYILLACIPYVRYLILHNHAYIHYFFTYRAQCATVLAVIFILELLTDRRWLIHGTTKKRRR